MAGDYRNIVESCNDPMSFFSRVLDETNVSTDKSVYYALSTSSIERLEGLMNEIKMDSSIKDIWQCRHRIVTSILEKNRQSDILNDILDGNYEEPEKSPMPSVVYGEKLNSALEVFISRVLASLASGSGGMYVICGYERSGKTSVLDYVTGVISSKGYPVYTWEYITGSGESRIRNKEASVVVLDDSDSEIPFGFNYRDIQKIKKEKRILLTTCCDLSKISKVSCFFEMKLLQIPDYTKEEMISIISRYKVADHGVSHAVARTVVDILTAQMEKKPLMVARDVLNYALVRYRDDFDVLSDDSWFTTRKVILDSISACTGKVLKQDYDELSRDIRISLKRHIKGQDQVIDEVVPVLCNINMGFSDPTKPAAVFLAAGPTGTGKTELGKAIAKVLYDGSYYKEDMNTYFDRHISAKMLGAPPGYTGNQDIPAMMKFVMNAKQGVIILDEIEKAHQSIQDVIQEMLDTGFIRDSSGREYDFRGFTIVMTTNAGFDSSAGKKAAIGFSGAAEEDSDAMAAVEKSGKFNRSFLARTRILSFVKPDRYTVMEIAAKMLNELTEWLSIMGIDSDSEIAKDVDIIDEIVEHYYRYDGDKGAREMHLFVNGELKNRIISRVMHSHGEESL